MSIISCSVCGCEFERRSNRQIYCSSKCKDKGTPSKRKNRCSKCGKPMQGKLNPKSICNPCRGVEPYVYKRSSPRNGEVQHGTTTMYGYGCRCDLCRAAASERMREYKERYRAKHGMGPSSATRRRFKEEHGYWPQARYSYDIPHSTRRAVYERDNWVCQICYRPISREYDPYDRLAPSLDHIVPRSTQLISDHSEDNLRMVHVVCNSYRSDSDRTDFEVAKLTAQFFA